MKFIEAPKCVGDKEASVPLADDNGYIKNACFVFIEMTQSQAEAYCKAGGMTLFQIDSAETQAALFKYLQEQLPTTPAVFRVDGLRDEPDGEWFYYANGKEPAFDGLDWLDPVTKEDTLDGQNSLVVENMAYPMQKYSMTFKVDGLEPSIPFLVICQFTDPNA